MKIIMCDNGHFYDADKYLSCPNCEMESTTEYTVANEAFDSGKDFLFDFQTVLTDEKDAKVSICDVEDMKDSLAKNVEDSERETLLNHKIQFCTNCGQRIEEEGMICSSCGYNVKENLDMEITLIMCNRCRELIIPKVSFCPYCGVKKR